MKGFRDLSNHNMWAAPETRILLEAATEKSSKMRKLSREMNEKGKRKGMCQNQRPKTGCT